MTPAPRSADCSARSTSPRSARGTVSITELSYGLRTSIFCGVSIHCPATYIFMTPPPLAASQPWVQCVAEGVAEQVGAEDGEADGDAGEEDQVRGLLRVFGGGDREHAAP